MIREKRTLKDLDLLDRFLFAEATEDTEILEIMLEIILGREVVLEQMPQAEKEIRRTLWSKKVRLDVLGRDVNSELYNAEAQKEDTGALPKRSRYYNSMIDSKLLEIGETDYNKLNNVTVIMISPFDLFGKGMFKYTFKMTCEQNPEIALGDGVTRIFLNTRGTDSSGCSEELIELLHFIENTDSETAAKATSEKVRKIHEKVEAIKQSEEVGVRFMNAWEEKQMERQEEKKEIAKRLKAMGLTKEQIKEATELSEEIIEKL